MMPRYRSFRDFDWLMLAVTLAIAAIGVFQIYSATRGTAFEDVWWRQIIWIGLGLGLMWLGAAVDYHTLLGHVPLFYVLTGGTLLLTFAVGRRVFGSRRWIKIAGASFQPSEFAKLMLILLVARYLAELKRGEVEVRDLFKLGVLVGIPTLLVIQQPDLGTALTYVAILGAGVLLAGLQWRHLAAIVLIGGFSLPVAWPFLNDYQKQRLETFVNPDADPRGAGYQVIQSRIAVGHGGLWGTGMARGTQTQLGFLPVGHTDFIFSTFAEEHGFVGVVVVLGLYFLLVMQIVQNAQAAPDRSGMYLCMGVAGLLLFHLLVNVGMVVGSMPVTGIPLPLMSYGGSHVFSVFLMLGLVNNVRLRRFAS
jgi:rod shape determining protein RodA